MNITKELPIIIDFVPTPNSIVALRLKLKGIKEKIKINIDVNILYRDPSINDRIFILNPGIQNIFTNTDDRIYTLKFNVSEFKDNILSFVRMAIDNTYNTDQKNTDQKNTDQKIIVECMKLICTKNLSDDVLEQMLISKEIINDKNIEKSKDIENNVKVEKNIEIISPQAAMVIQHTQPKAVKTAPWTLMTTRN